MKLKAKISIILVILMILYLLTACMPDSSVNGDVEPDASEITEPDTEPDTESNTESDTKTDSVDQRYFIFRIWNFDINSIGMFKSIVDRVELDGFNAIKIHIPWFHVEKQGGVYEYSSFDPMFDYVINEKGMKVAVSIDLTRRIGDQVLTDDDIMHDAGGNICMGGSPSSDRMQISLNSENAVSKATQFYYNAVSHYDELYGDDILFYLPAFSQYAESEYWCATTHDYSDNAINAFHDFLEENYGTIGVLNAVLLSSYSSFDEVMPPETITSDTLGQIFYIFRHRSLKNLIDELAAAQKSAAPDSKFALQFGSVCDANSFMRGTIGFVDLCESADVLWVDDAPLTNHRFSMDYLISSLPAHMEIAQEIDGPYHTTATPELYLAQGMQCFERGATYMSIANWFIDADYERYSYAWREIANTWLGEEVPELILPTDASPVIEVSLLDLFRMRNISSVISQYNYIAKSGEAVRIIVTDDLTNQLPQKASAFFSPSFSSTQGEGGWYYKSYLDGIFTDMTFDEESRFWKGEDEFALITPAYMHPDKRDSALVFVPDQDGEMKVDITCNVPSPLGDGVVFYLLHNGQRIALTKIEPEQTYTTTVALTVKAGDEIAFIINKYNQNTYDSTALSVFIEYK